MKKVKCKQCDCDIYTEYDPMPSLNEKTSFFDLFKKKKIEIKYFSELSDKPSETCNTSIYLTCANNHTENYFCTIKTKQ